MNRPALAARLVLAAAVLASPLAACGDLIDQVQSQEIAIALLVKTPDLENPETHETVTGATTITVFFGHVDTGDLLQGQANEGSYTGITGASVHLTYMIGGDAKDIVVPDRGAGTYALDSTTEPALGYGEVDYTVTLKASGKTYRMKVRAPAPTDIVEVAAAPDRVIEHSAGTALTVTRADARGADDNDVAFVNLASVDGAASATAYTNAPSDALGFLRLVLDDDEWRTDAFTIPGNEFTAGAGYLVTLTPLENGDTVTSGGENSLFVGSSFFAGVAAGGAVVVP